jgi:hypothetical protein
METTIFRVCDLKMIVKLSDLAILHSRNASPFHPSGFLRVSKQLVRGVSIFVGIFRLLFSGRILNSGALERVHFTIVYHYRRFGFLHLSKFFAMAVSIIVQSFR